MSGAGDYADLRSGPKMYGDMRILVYMYCIGISYWDIFLQVLLSIS
jgi:hypothetical protein